VTADQSIEAPVTPDQDQKLAGLIAEQEAIFIARQPESARLAGTARGALAGGVTSSWQITAPQPVWLGHGQGSKVYDVDGNEYVDLHGGYGAALAGHAHPAIKEAIQAQVARGTHFAQPTPDAITVATELAARFGLPRWRFANSGTEATMDAVHLMRSITGRDLIIKIEGCYHGHHDSVQVSVAPEPADVGPADRPASAPSSTGLPKAITDLTLIGPFNDLDCVTRLLEEHRDQVAGMTGIQSAINDHGLTAHVVTAGAKGCVVFAAEPVRNYRGFLGADDRYSHAHWLYQHNGGVFLPPWGKIEQWLISVQHDEADIDRLVENFAVFAQAVGGAP